MRVDLNADVGEGATAEARRAELSILPAISSVNIACGAHAGDLQTMHEFVAAAASAGLAIGAHPGYADRSGMGRRDQQLEPAEVIRLVREQIEQLAAVAAAHGIHLSHVKPHGALYNQAARDESLAAAIAAAVVLADPTLSLVGLTGSALIVCGRQAGLRVAEEAFADRAYWPDGALVPRGSPGAVLTDIDAVIGQAISLVTRRQVRASDGSMLSLTPDTLCMHGDTPGAAVLARHVRAALVDAGVEIRSLGAHA